LGIHAERNRWGFKRRWKFDSADGSQIPFRRSGKFGYWAAEVVAFVDVGTRRRYFEDDALKTASDGLATHEESENEVTLRALKNSERHLALSIVAAAF
jgi:hypothetical protein